MAIVNGVVEKVSNNFAGKVGLLVNGNWYNGFTTFPDGKPTPQATAVAGDSVTFDDGGKTHIKNFKKGGGAPAASGGGSAPAANRAPASGFPMEYADRSRAINRQNALTNAVTFMSKAEEASPEDVIETARYFEAYTTGDLDKIILEEAQKEMTGG